MSTPNARVEPADLKPSLSSVISPSSTSSGSASHTTSSDIEKPVGNKCRAIQAHEDEPHGIRPVQAVIPSAGPISPATILAEKNVQLLALRSTIRDQENSIVKLEERLFQHEEHIVKMTKQHKQMEKQREDAHTSLDAATSETERLKKQMKAIDGAYAEAKIQVAQLTIQVAHAQTHASQLASAMQANDSILHIMRQNLNRQERLNSDLQTLKQSLTISLAHR